MNDVGAPRRLRANRPVQRAFLAVVPPSLVSQLGFYAVLPLLPELLAQRWGADGPLVTGLSLAVLSASMRGAGIFLSPWLQRTPMHWSALAGMLLAAAGFIGLAVVPSALIVPVALGVVGGGISATATVLRVTVSELLDRPDEANSVFASVQVAANVGAALGPLLGAILLSRGGGQGVFTTVGVAYGFAGIVAFWGAPARRPTASPTARSPLAAAVFRAAWRDVRVRETSFVSAIGCLMYAQLFSAISIHMMQVGVEVGTRSIVFAMNAGIVIVAQYPVTCAVNRRMRSGMSPLSVLRAGVAIFCLAYGVLACTGRAVVGVVVAVIVFSIAETVFSPMLNTAFSGMDGYTPLEIFTVRQTATATGETIGALAGGALYLVVFRAGHSSFYWAVLLALGVLILLHFSRTRPRSEHP